jgi:hypothetical protein
MHAESIDTERAAQGTRWWSVVQAIAWIVERTPEAVERARSVRTIGRLSGLQPSSAGDDTPISLRSAPFALLQAAQAKSITIRGSQGQRPPMPVPVRQGYWLRDCGGVPSIGDEVMRRAGVGLLWSDLWIRADECMSRWPAPVKAADFEQDAALSEPPATDDEKLHWMLEYQRGLKDVGKHHGREIILSAARDRFNVQHKVVRAIWDARKTGRGAQRKSR